MIFIFDFGFRQRGFAGNAPAHRFQAFFHAAVADKFAEFPHDNRFIRKIHRNIGMFPIAEDAESFEFVALNIDIFIGIFAAEFSDFAFDQLFAFFAQFDFDFMFNRKAVTIPARNIRGIIPHHGAGFNNNVF